MLCSFGTHSEKEQSIIKNIVSHLSDTAMCFMDIGSKNKQNASALISVAISELDKAILNSMHECECRCSF